jgi:thiol:disulfide interchange protein DsbC
MRLVRHNTTRRVWAQTCTALLMGHLAAAAGAQPQSNASIKAAIEANTAGRVKVEAVRPTPIAGLFEVTTKGLDLFYADASGRYGLVDGRLVDMRDQKDLTVARLIQLRSIDFAKLPLQLAIKRGNGSRVLAVFEDPTCPVCRALHKFIAQLPDTTVYHFPFPVITPQAMPIAVAAWCATDRSAAWEKAMSGGISPGPNQPPPCDISGIQQIIKAGDALQVNGTPTVFLANGRRLQGAVPPDDFLAALDESSRSPVSAPAAR